MTARASPLLDASGVRHRAHRLAAAALALASGACTGPTAPSADLSVPTVDITPVSLAPAPDPHHLPAPTLAAISPASGLPGTVVDVELSGTNFVPLKTTVQVVTTLRDPVVNVRVKDSTTITATIAIPAGSTPRTHDIVVITPGGVSERRPFVVRAANAQLPVIGAFGITPATVPKNSTATLTWKGIFNATTCEIDNGVGAVSCSGGVKGVAPKGDTSYRLTAIGPGGSANATAGVRVIVGTVPAAAHGTQTFNYTGGTQTFVVPDGVTEIEVEVSGAQGGSGETTDGIEDGGSGEEINATVPVTPREELVIVVGGEGETPTHDNQAGHGGFNGGGDAPLAEHAGGGGGGESDIREGGSSPENIVVEADGGGGGRGGGGGQPSGDGGKGGHGGQSAAGDKVKDKVDKPGNNKGNGKVVINW